MSEPMPEWVKALEQMRQRPEFRPTHMVVSEAGQREVMRRTPAWVHVAALVLPEFLWQRLLTWHANRLVRRMLRAKMRLR